MKLAPSLFAAALLTASIAQAADLKSGKASEPAAPEITQVPGEDIFGFTSGTDVGSPGDKGVALENDGAFGSRAGRYRVLTQKLELSRTFAENWSYAASAFGAWTSVKNDDFSRTAYGFDGLSMEMRHRVIERSATNPFALTLALEPRWGRIDTGTGLRSDSYSAEAKLQIDAPINDRLFWAMNLNFGSARSRDAIERTWSSDSESSVSSALAYAVVEDKVFIGAEARWQQAYAKAFFGALNGQALYFGPTMAVKAAPNVTINLVMLPQIAGKARGVGGPLDLDNFERANFRAKIVVGF